MSDAKPPPWEAAPGGHRRAEPPGALRPEGVAGVPVPRRQRVRRHGRLPAGGGHRPVPGRRRRAHPRVPRLRPGRGSTGIPRRVRLVVPCDRTARCPRSPGRSVRRDAGMQPSGHLLAARAVAARSRRHAVRLRPPRPLPRALRLPLRGQPGNPLQGADLPREADVPRRRPRHVDERVVCRHRHVPWAQARRARHRRADRPGPRAAPSARCRSRRTAAAAGTSSPTSASWDRRTASTSPSRRPTSSSTRWGATTSRSPSWGPVTAGTASSVGATSWD